jgi:long-chain acyl-CoA synthetase
MTDNNRFHLPSGVALYAGETRVDLHARDTLQGFGHIPADPADAALAGLAARLRNADAFCISDHALPEHCHTAPPFFLTLTGGSSGAPKAIRRTQASWRASFEVNIQQFDLRRRRAVAVLGGLAHSLALYGVLEGLHAGLDVHALAGLAATVQRRVLAAHQIGVLYATPTQLRLLAHGTPDPLPQVEIILCGGGALDQNTTEAVSTLCPNARLHQFYGAAETSFVTITDAATPAGSVGKAYPGVELKLQDGLLWVRSPYLFDGYAHGASSQTRWEDGFLTVGELARMIGRASRQVNIADQLVSPEPLEAFVEVHSDGGPNAVLPVPDRTRGTRLILVLEGPQDTARAQALSDACRGQFGALIAPRTVLFYPKLPRLGSGKIDIDQLGKWLGGQT